VNQFLNPTDFILNGLTEEQRRVVTHVDGPAVVIACPGSGKTRALTYRMGYLVHRGVPPGAILGITFTRAAAAEMKARLARLIPQARGVRLFTFHGLAWRILTDAQGRPNVLAEREQRAMAGQLLREFGLNADQTAVDGLLTDFAYFVGAQLPPERFRPGSCDPDRFRQIWARYGELKQDRGGVDFDDLIAQASDLLRRNPTHRQAQVSRIRYLLVDEFQDTNALQWEFLQLLIPAGDNIMVVGDDDQAIYGWRGASPSFMLDFPRRFPGCAELRLSRNFRSTASIVAPAGKLIAANSRRFIKRFAAERAAGQPPVFLRPDDAADEAERITAAIRGRLAAGADLTSLAVLYRTHLLAYPLMNRLDRAGIPYRVIGGRPNPFTRWMARDVLSYLRWAHGEAGLEEIVRLLRRPVRTGISRDLVQELQQAAVAPDEALDWLSERVVAVGSYEVRSLREQLRRLAQMQAGRAISFIRVEMGYDDYIRQYCRWSGSDPQEAGEVLGVMEQIPEPDQPARVFIDLAAQEERRGEADDPSTPAVTLASFHGSKGLEWNEVWLLSAVEGAVPHRLTLEGGSPEALEEERRLFYVGMTRAKDVLTISAPRRLLGSDAAPSRFVTEAGVWAPRRAPLPLGNAPVSPVHDLPQPGPPLPAGEDVLPPVLPKEGYVPGAVCWHRRFGEGVIRWVNAEGGLAEIEFREVGETKLLCIDVCVAARLIRVARVR